MRKNKKLYKLVIVLVALLCVCLIINFTLNKNNQKIKDNTEIIDINSNKDDDDTKTSPVEDSDDNKTSDSGNSTNNNGPGSGSGDGNAPGTKPVIVDGEGDTVVQSDDGDKILPTEDGTVDDVLEGGTVSVNDNDNKWTTNTEIRIFDVPQIAPGDGSTYEFVVNNNTPGNVNYSISFEEDNIANANMLYKLKRNDEYIAGDENTWVKYNELNFDSRILNKSYMDKYNIEWKWVPAENDTSAGRMLGAKYGLNIKVDAASTTEYDRYSNATLNPLTGDKILNYIEIALLSMIVLVLLTIKRRQKD